jgi:hypothetical protein
MIVPGISCACGNPELVALKPGTNDRKFAWLIIARGTPSIGWCWDCWPARPEQRDLFAEAPK